MGISYLEIRDREDIEQENINHCNGRIGRRDGVPKDNEMDENFWRNQHVVGSKKCRNVHWIFDKYEKDIELERQNKRRRDRRGRVGKRGTYPTFGSS